jgi:hypothetical protein
MEVLRFPKTGIVVAYYQGAYGATILIDTTSRHELLTIRSMFLNLAQGKIDLVNLVNTPGVTSMGLDALILRRVNSGEQGDKSLELKNKKSKRIEFLWSLPSVEWWARVNLTDGFTDAPGHHYLTDEGIDDAIVLLQFKQSAALRGLQ